MLPSTNGWSTVSPKSTAVASLNWSPSRTCGARAPLTMPSQVPTPPLPHVGFIAPSLTQLHHLGVSAVAHVASVRDVNVTPDEMIRTTVAGTLVCLQAAAKEPSVQRFVLTSSSRAVRSGQAYCNADTVSSDEFDNQTLALAKNLPESLSPLQKSVIAYFASKVASEQAFWDWVKTNKPHFTANAVVPCPIYGSPLDVPHQGYPSTSRIPIQVLDGHVDSMKHLQRCT